MFVRITRMVFSSCLERLNSWEKKFSPKILQKSAICLHNITKIGKLPKMVVKNPNILRIMHFYPCLQEVPQLFKDSWPLFIIMARIIIIMVRIVISMVMNVIRMVHLTKGWIISVILSVEFNLSGALLLCLYAKPRNFDDFNSKPPYIWMSKIPYSLNFL